MQSLDKEIKQPCTQCYGIWVILKAMENLMDVKEFNDIHTLQTLFWKKGMGNAQTGFEYNHAICKRFIKWILE